MAKISININLSPEKSEAGKHPETHQNISYCLSDLKITTKLEELNDFIHGWLKKQKK